MSWSLALLAALALASMPARAARDRDDVSVQPAGGGGGGGHGGGGGSSHGGGGVGRGAGVSPSAGVIPGGGGVSRGMGAGPMGGAHVGHSPPVVIHMRQVTVPAPRQPAPSARVQSGVRPIAPPARDASGRPFRGRTATSPPAHSAVVTNGAVVRSVQSAQRVEVVPNHFFWHDVHGNHFCHFFDGHAHWFGFYWGPAFYWTQWWGGYWWWYDPSYYRWVYWWNGYWWWPGPGGVPYAYVDNNYYPYQEVTGAVIVKNPQLDQAPPGMPAEGVPGRSFASPDHRRMVQISGDQGEAYLYDSSRGSPSYMAYLARGARQARFSGGTEGRPLRILLDFSDGSFALYDEQGRSLDFNSPANANQNSEEELPGPPPEPASAPPGSPKAPPKPPSE